MTRASEPATTTDFAGIPFRVADAEEAVRLTLELLDAPSQGSDVHLFNAYSVALAHSNAQYSECARQSTMNFADGKPVAMFSRFVGHRLRQVRGPQYFEDVLAAGVGRGVRHFFLGSTPETLASLKTNMESRFPNLQIVGMHSPEFRELSPVDLARQDEEIRRCEPDIVWVGLGTPKQDLEARRLAEVGFNAAAVGAAFDFSAGTKASAPRWMREAGLEWFHRLLTEPRRLWKRYLWGNTLFLLIVAREIVRR